MFHIRNRQQPVPYASPLPFWPGEFA